MSFLSLVDTFSDDPFKGNPAIVCLTKKPLDDDTMISIAREMNVSETAFLFSLGEENYSLRLFDIHSEIDAYGHATYAAAHVLHAREGMNQFINFQTRNGEINAKLLPKGGILIPYKIPLSNSFKPIKSLEGLNLPILSSFEYDNIYLIETNPDILLSNNLFDSKLFESKPKGIVLTSKSLESKYDIISRVFILKDTLVEDIASIEIQIPLFNFWSKKLNKNTIKSYQASNRGAMFHLELTKENINITGKCNTIFQGELII